MKEEQLDDAVHGFPRVDDRVVGLKNRYGWAVGERPGSGGGFDAPGVVLKYDLEKGGSQMHDFGPAAQPGEFVFAESDAKGGEDDGYAMGFVYDKSRNSSDLVILDAAQPEKDPIATIHMPQRVPAGFHGSWVRD